MGIISNLIRIFDPDITLGLMMQAFAIFKPVRTACEEMENKYYYQSRLYVQKQFTNEDISDKLQKIKGDNKHIHEKDTSIEVTAANIDDTNDDITTGEKIRLHYDKLGSSAVVLYEYPFISVSMKGTILLFWLMTLKCIALLIIFNIDMFESYRYLNCYIPGRIYFPSSSLNASLIFTISYCVLILFWFHSNKSKILQLDSLIGVLTAIKFSIKRWQGTKELKLDKKKKKLIEPDYIPKCRNNMNLNDKEYFDQIFLDYARNSWYHTIFYLAISDNVFKDAEPKLILKDHRDFFSFNRKLYYLKMFTIFGVSFYLILVSFLVVGFEIFLLRDESFVNFYPGCFKSIERDVVENQNSSLPFSKISRNSLKITYRIFFLLPFDMLDNSIYYFNLGEYSKKF